MAEHNGEFLKHCMLTKLRLDFLCLILRKKGKLTLEAHLAVCAMKLHHVQMVKKVIYVFDILLWL